MEYWQARKLLSALVHVGERGGLPTQGSVGHRQYCLWPTDCTIMLYRAMVYIEKEELSRELLLVKLAHIFENVSI